MLIGMMFGVEDRLYNENGDVNCWPVLDREFME